jgi:D-alanyl-D-alanine carboxypeptidase (penicillin-binding protein 5/6)
MRPDPLLNAKPRTMSRRLPLVIGVVVLVLLLVGGGAFQLLRPVPAVAATPTANSEQRVTGDPPTLPWPTKGQAALAIQGIGMVGTYGGETPVPIASVTKVMTAYVVLQDHPLQAGQQGPEVTFTADDVNNYKQRLASGESVVAVTAGQKLNEYQLLQGLLLPSGNNLADTLGRFDAGSVDAFVARMNATATKLGLKHTKFADTNGASNNSQSIPADLVVLSQAAMAQPVFAEIAKQPEATLPGAGRVFNVNSVLGQEGIVGVKTGSLPDLAIANFAFAATTQVGDQTVLVFGAVTSQDSLAKAFEVSKALIRAARGAIKQERVVTATDPVGYYQAPWGAKATVLAPRDVSLLTWPGMVRKTSIEMRPIMPPAGAGAGAGTMTVSLGDQQVKLDLTTSGAIPEPGKRWRLTRTS